MDHHSTSSSWASWLSEGFMPHGHCFGWEPGILWLHVGADALIATAYFAIPVILATIVRRREDLQFRGIFRLFAAFILACGVTHVLAIVTFWHPWYRLAGWVKAGTAGVSAFTAFAMIPMLPRALALPSPRQLAEANRRLSDEVEERKQAEARLEELTADLERRVALRTAELAAANERLRASNEDLEHFAHAASHDLRGPLRTVVSFADLLERSVGDTIDAQGQEALDYVRHGSREMASLLDGMLAYSSVTADAPAIEPVDLRVAVNDVITVLTADLEVAGGCVEVSGDGRVFADPTQLRQVVQNLLANAIRFRREDVALRVQVTLEASEEGASIVVTDNGTGFDSSQSERIFGMFTRVGPPGEHAGRGIGLAVCRRILQRHQGSIQASAVPGAGATFRTWWPHPADVADTVSSGQA